MSEESSSVTLPFFLDFLFFFLAPSDEMNNDMSKTKRIRWRMQIERIVATVLLTSSLPPLLVYSRGWTQRIDSLVEHVQTEIVHRAADSCPFSAYSGIKEAQVRWTNVGLGHLFHLWNLTVDFFNPCWIRNTHTKKAHVETDFPWILRFHGKFRL